MDITSTGLSHPLTSSSLRTSEQLSSGQQINRASDGPASIQIIEQFTSQIQGNSAAHRNVIDGVSALQIAQGGLSQISDSLQQLRELGIQAGNGTLNDSDRAAIQSQADELLGGIQDAIKNSQFNGRSQLNNSDSQTIQSTSNANSAQQLPSFDLATDFKNAGLFDIQFDAQSVTTSLNSIDDALNISDSVASAFGRSENSFNNQAQGLIRDSLNQASSRSQIQDTDYAASSSALAREQVQEKVEITMLAQANANRDQVLKLLSF